MKLVYRILLHLSWALSLLLAAWAVLFYFTLIDEINDEVDDALEARAEVIVKRVLAGRELPVPADEGNNGYFLHEVSPQYAAAQHHAASLRNASGSLPEYRYLLLCVLKFKFKIYHRKLFSYWLANSNRRP